VHAVVIGGGIIGTASALSLLESGYDVTLIDRNHPNDGVATNVNAGLISPGHALSWSNPAMLRRLPQVLLNQTPNMRVRAHLDPALLRWGLTFLRNCTSERAISSSLTRGRLGRRSADRLLEVHSAYGLKTPIHRGMVFIHDSIDTLAAQHDAMQVLARDGHHLPMLDREAVLQLEPALADSRMPIAGAIHHPKGFTVDSRSITAEIRQILEEAGASSMSADARSLTMRDGRVVAVRTSDGTDVEGDVFIVAAGVHSQHLLPRVGRIPPTYPVRGYGITWRELPPETGPQIGGLNETDLIAWSRSGDALRVTGIAEFNRFSHAIHEDDLGRVLRSAYRLFPFLEDAGAPDVGSGFRPMTADGLPRIGKAGTNLYVNMGHGNLGWTMAFGSAEILAKAVRGEDPDALALIVAPPPFQRTWRSRGRSGVNE
jgi:D-amino-acid dehydrogenase